MNAVKIAKLESFRKFGAAEGIFVGSLGGLVNVAFVIAIDVIADAGKVVEEKNGGKRWRSENSRGSSSSSMFLRKTARFTLT